MAGSQGDLPLEHDPQKCERFSQISLRNLRTLDCDMETSDISDVLKKNMLQHLKWGEFYRLGDSIQAEHALGLKLAG